MNAFSVGHTEGYGFCWKAEYEVIFNREPKSMCIYFLGFRESELFLIEVGFFAEQLQPKVVHVEEKVHENSGQFTSKTQKGMVQIC